MKLTPLDVQQKAFRKLRLGGFDEREVRAFLELCANEMEELTRRLHKQEEELRLRETQIADYKSREQLLQKTLTTAQKLSDEMKASTRKEAEIVLSDAELQAEKIIANAQSKRLQLVGEIDELKRTRTSFLQQLTGLLDTHRALLDSVRGASAAETPKDPAASDNVSFLAPPTKRADTKK
jgi:cell division initiation protein